MNNHKDVSAFYVGAAIFFDLESDEVDEILRKHNLDADYDELQLCASIVKKEIGKVTNEQ